MQPKQPANFNIDTFSPPVVQRETDVGALVEVLGGPEPLGVLVYPFRGRSFLEFQAYPPEPTP